MLIETLINQCKKLRKNMLSNMYKKEKAPLFSQFIWLSTWKLKFNFGKPFRVKKSQHTKHTKSIAFWLWKDGVDVPFPILCTTRNTGCYI